MKIESHAISDIGLGRANNEDAFGEIPGHFYVLADGMGGHQAGEVASHEVIESLIKSITHLLQTQRSLSNDELILELKESILEANSWIYHLSQEHETMQGMGTTLCCLLLNQYSVIYAHIGDSRIYRFRDQLERLTQDHSLRREMAERYSLTEKKLPSKHVITRAVGTSYHVEPDVNLSSVRPNDLYFLCSDGLSDVVSEKEMESVIRNTRSLKDACETLVQMAIDHGGQDNITLLMVKIS